MHLLLQLLLISCIATLVYSGNGSCGNPRIAPPNSRPRGKSYVEWSELWWQRMESIPSDRNPLLDATGEHCTAALKNNVIFLAGSFTGVATRTCTIPPGTAILVPLMNIQCNTVPIEPIFTVEQLLPCIQSLRSDPIERLIVTIDGVSINAINYSFTTGLHCFTLPVGNIFEVKPGVYTGAATGYYLFLEPLPVGSHTIEYHTTQHGFSQDISYVITVAKPPHCNHN